MENNYSFYYNPATNTILICSTDEIVKCFEKIETSFKEFDRKKFKERIKEFNKEQK